MKKYFLNLDKSPNIGDPFGYWGLFDRTRIIFDVPEIESLMPLGQLKDTKTFAELCDDRAESLAAKAEGRDIYVLWSGGIDSTLVVVALLKVCRPDQLVVVYSEESVREYLWFFESYVSKLRTLKIKNEVCDADTVFNKDPNAIVCTGEIADQVLGSMMYKNYADADMLLKNWRFATHFKNPKFVDRIEEFVAACPQKITNVKEFLWWYNYCVKYQPVCMRMIVTSPGVVLEKRLFHFFNTPEFNDWSVSTPIEEKFYGTKFTNYKMVAKEYIYKETKDSDYRDNKTKENSPGFGPIIFEPPFTKITTDWIWEP